MLLQEWRQIYISRQQRTEMIKVAEQSEQILHVTYIATANMIVELVCYRSKYVLYKPLAIKM